MRRASAPSDSCSAGVSVPPSTWAREPGAEPGQRRERGEGPDVVDVATKLVDDLLDELVAEVHTGEAGLREVIE